MLRSHKDIETSLQESEEMNRLILTNISDGIILTDNSGKPVFVCPHADIVFGYTSEEIFNFGNVYRILGDDLFDHRELEAHGEIRNIEREITDKFGVSRVLIIHVKKVSIRNGTTLFACRDITERKRSEEQLENSERKYRALFENSQDAIFILDGEGIFTDCNSIAMTMFGCDREELLRKGAPFFSPPSQPDGSMTFERVSQITSAALNGEPQRFVWQHQRPDGTLFDVDVSLNSVEIGGEKWVQGNVRDITQLKRSERALHESETRYRALVENQLEAVCRWLPDTTLTYVNETYCRLHGKSREELLGKPFLNFVPREARSDLIKHINSLVSHPRTEYSEHLVPKGDKGTFWMRWSDCPIIDERGNLLEFQSVGMDITDRKEAELSLITQQEQLKKLATELAMTEERERQNIATELHDTVGQKLAIAKMKLDSLAGNPACQEKGGDLEKAYDLISNAIACIRSLTFEISPPILHMVGLDAAVQSLCEKYEEETDMLVEFVGEGEANFIGMNLRGTLYRMVRELLHNIAKHARAEQAAVTLTTTEGNIEITVEDNGIGSNATEVLLQGNRNHSIGLFSIKQRLEYLGGSMTIDSQPGAGTRVTLRVPLQSELPEENGGI